MEKRHIVIGDIHGCFNEMLELLDKVSYNPQRDHLVLLGDVIDKGPLPVKTVQYLRNLPGEVTLIKGNHEERFCRWNDYENRRAKTGEENPIKRIPDEFKIQRDGLDSEDIKWLKDGKIYFQFKSGEHQFITCHAGVPEYIYIKGQLPDHERFTRKTSNPWLRLRHVTDEGKFVCFGNESDETIFWANRYDGRFGTALFGHNPFSEQDPVAFPHAIAMDGGCVHGERMHAAVILDGEISFVSVTARKSYAEKYIPEKAC